MSKRKHHDEKDTGRPGTEQQPRQFQNNFDAFSKDTSETKWKQISEEYSAKLRAGISDLLPRLNEGLQSELSRHDNSIYTGSTGIALLHLLLHDVYTNGEHLMASYQSLRPSLDNLQGRRFTFLCGDAGPLAVGAAVFSKLGREAESKECISKLHALQDIALDRTQPDELLYGRVGYLYALLYVQSLPSAPPIDDTPMERVYRAIIDSGTTLSRQERSKSPLMYAWHGKRYYGAAHGLSGILCLLMQVSYPWSQEFLHSHVKSSVDCFLDLALPSGNFPSSRGNDSDRLVHWCHGAPGIIHMLVQAHKVFPGDSKYLEAAKRCSDVIWSRGLLRKGYGLCHGTAGNAYGFLTLYQATNDREYLYKAYKFADWCLDYGSHGCRTPDRPFSLFEGMAGTIYFLSDLLKDPKTAKFPGLFL